MDTQNPQRAARPIKIKALGCPLITNRLPWQSLDNDKQQQYSTTHLIPKYKHNNTII